MKTLLPRLALLLTLGLALPACQDALDLQPQQSIDAATALDTPGKVGSAVVGIYGQLANANLYGSSLVLLPDLMGSDGYLNYNNMFADLAQLATRNALSTNGYAEGAWQRAYKAINQANLVLGALPVVTTAAEANQYEGEARFLRALVYFDLVRLYAQQYQPGGANAQPGVPLPLAGSLTLAQAEAAVPRATVAAVYTQIISDLTTAQAKLPATNDKRATRYAAQALLARVYLQQGDYAAARAAAAAVIAGSGRTLAGPVAAVFTNRNSGESLFEIEQSEQNNASTLGDLGLASHYGNLRIAASFARQYGPADARGTDSLSATATRKLIYLSNGLRTLKWRTPAQNIPLIRLAEMYLIRAEADVRAGNAAAALADVNLLRQRSGAAPLGAVTLAEVLRERQLELAFEGFRLHDFKRTGTSLPSGVPSTDPKLVLPIPQHEITLNPLLVQNPGY